MAHSKGYFPDGSMTSNGTTMSPPQSAKRVTFDGLAAPSSGNATTTTSLAASSTIVPPTTPGGSQLAHAPVRPALPVTTPSNVHINQSLEESLRRAEEDRQRRHLERRQKKRKLRLEKERLQQGRANGLPQDGQSVTSPNATPSASAKPLPDVPEERTDASTSTLLPSRRMSANSRQLRISVDDTRDDALELLEEEDDEDSEEGDESDLQDAYLDEEDEDDFDEMGRSLTRQLAETAVSVREMSRELGRARVKSNIQSVLIVTKARDNQLIKLTREVALYLMKTPRNGRSRGLIVYVDSQLKKSKRFDAAGIEKDNPELFRSNSSHAHHHHHHHHHGHSHRESFSSKASRRSSAASSGSLNNMFSMTSSASLASNGYSSMPTSGASTPGLNSGNGKPFTRLTEALVNRQLERELSRRHSQSTGQLRSEALSDAVSAPASPSLSGTSPQEDQGLLRYWNAEMCSKSPHLFDLVVTLGGDGTVLFTSWLFQHVVPPVIPFALGSLGFLTNFDYSNHQKVLESAINDGVRVNLRMRFTATIYRAVNEEEEEERRRCVRSGTTGEIFMETLRTGGWQAIESGAPPAHNSQGGHHPCGKDRDVVLSITRPAESFEVLNDLVVDRGPSPYVSLLELFGDEHHMTTVQADGLCVATPTGSTAYSLSAGGSLVHPEIPTLLITPICPHTLSFRPMLLPDSMELRICVPYNSRSTAWASFDGRGRVELRQGDHIKVTASAYPFPTVCADKQSTDWFQAIQRTLKWNERQRQKSFVVVEHPRDEPHDPDASKAKAESGYRGSSSNAAARMPQTLDKHKSAQEDDDDDDDGTFDIDDVSDQAPSADSTEAQNVRQAGEPAIHAPSSSASIPPEDDGSAMYANQESLHEPRHLRQYAIRDSTSSKSSKDRTPKAGNFKQQEGKSKPARPRRYSAPGHASNEKVKAFVVFGADSSDAESSASETS